MLVLQQLLRSHAHSLRPWSLGSRGQGNRRSWAELSWRKEKEGSGLVSPRVFFFFFAEEEERKFSSRSASSSPSFSTPPKKEKTSTSSTSSSTLSNHAEPLRVQVLLPGLAPRGVAAPAPCRARAVSWRRKCAERGASARGVRGGTKS